MKANRICALLFFVNLALRVSGAQAPGVRFISYTEAQPVIQAFAGGEFAGAEIRDANVWRVWVRKHDAEIRQRVDRGIEDSISNLILFGTSYTQLPPIASSSDAAGPEGQLSSAAQARIAMFDEALTKATARNHRLLTVAAYLKEKGIARTEWPALLSKNMARYAREQADYEARLASAQASGNREEMLAVRATLYAQRGLSVDTSLMPNYAVADTLRVLKEKGVIRPGAIARIGVIGPGLDFADKRQGPDYYPEQTLQPFAMVDAVTGLGLGGESGVSVVTLDLNSLVNNHVKELSAAARRGRRYTIQLPLDASINWKPEARNYWANWGAHIGTEVRPIPPPKELRRVNTRAVAVDPKIASRMSAVDLDIVVQRVAEPPAAVAIPSPAPAFASSPPDLFSPLLPLSPSAPLLSATVPLREIRRSTAARPARFELMIATNILVYYNPFEQALALQNVSSMLAPGGVFISNTVLPSVHDPQLRFLGRRSVGYTTDHKFGDDIVVYHKLAATGTARE